MNESGASFEQDPFALIVTTKLLKIITEYSSKNGNGIGGLT